MKARVPGHPQGLGRAIWPLADTCYVDKWMQGLDEGASIREVRRTGDAHA